MPKMLSLCFAAALTVLAAGCGTSTVQPYSCSHGADFCYDYPTSATGDATLQACVGVNGSGGQYVPATCTGVNRVGTCTNATSVLITGTLVRYYSPAFTPLSAWQTCSLLGGTFTQN